MKKTLLILFAMGAFSLVSIMPGCDGSGSQNTNSSSGTTNNNPDNNAGNNNNPNR